MTQKPYDQVTETLPPKHILSKTPRAVLYGVGGVAALVLVAAVVSEIVSPGSIQAVREAVDVVVVELGLILAAVGAVVPAVLALMNLSDD